MFLMRNLTFILFNIISYVLTIGMQGQELVLKKDQKGSIKEEYFVLRNDKKVKHGNYISTFKFQMYITNIVEFGQYKNNERDGLWLSFYYTRSKNSLRSYGNYKDGLKDGVWFNYYTIDPPFFKVSLLTGSDKKTNILNREKGVDEFKIEVDTTGSKLMAYGEYFEGKKIDIWEYFNRNGILIQKYNYSKNTFEYILKKDQPLIFIGGTDKFLNEFFIVDEEIKLNRRITETSKLIYEIDKDGNYKFIDGSGESSFKNHIDEVIQKIPSDWICIDSTSGDVLQFIPIMDCSKDYPYLDIEFKVVQK